MYDVIIIGAGPAGISAGLYAKRANLNVLIVYHGESNIEKAHKIDNYYGFPDGITGKELYLKGIEQAKKIGIEVVDVEIINIEMNLNSLFYLKSKECSFETKSIILATGCKKIKNNIIGINEFEGKGISYCAICDGFFYRNKNVVVIGNGEFAISEANELKNIVSNVKILTNGLEKPDTTEFEIDDRKIKAIHGNSKVSNIEFVDGELMPIDGIFIAYGVASGNDFARKIGIQTQDEKIIVNDNMETNIKGIFSCGDLTGGLMQINKSVYEGAKAGLSVSEYIKRK